ncbi:MAG TPA: hypothetical protein VIC33_08820 [Vicinamibacterales bacterium]|jgi:hypothetical protein
MAEFNIRGDSVDVEQIMRQIRARIREKRGVDYTEQEIQEMANVKLEKFLDPGGVRSDLVAQFRQGRPEPPPVPDYTFESDTLFTTHRTLLRWIRTLLRPILKLFFNPNPLVHVLHTQAEINQANVRMNATRNDLDALYYEVMHNLVLEMTRLSIENKNLKMRVESVSGRLEFNERRARALEGVVQYRTTASTEPPAPIPRPAPETSGQPAPGPTGAATAEGPGQRSRRRRRRRGRRGTGTATGEGVGTNDVFSGERAEGSQGEPAMTGSEHDHDTEAGDDQDSGDFES